MSGIITFLLVGGLLLAAVGVVALVFALMRAREGYEDDAGFHYGAPGQAVEPASQTLGSENPWDYVEGASCPLSLTHSLGSVGDNHFSIHGH